MKQTMKDGLYLGFGLWVFSMVLSIPMGFLQMGYVPRYLLQLVFAIALLVRCCKKSSPGNWIGLFILEGLMLTNAVVHIVREYWTPGLTGFALWISGLFCGGAILILAVVTVILWLNNKD